MRNMRSRFRKAVCLILFLVGTGLSAQEIQRLSGDFSVKSQGDSLGNLTVGRFFYDRKEKTLVYAVSFPRSETWVFLDTALYRFSADSLLERQRGLAVADFSIFHLALNNHLSHYGLENSLYSMGEVSSEQGMVITTWEPPQMLEEMMGPVLISTKKKQLYGIVFLNPEEEIIRKQFFRRYVYLNGLPFPTEVVDVFFRESGKMYQKTTYENLSVNDDQNLAHFRRRLPLAYQRLLAN